MIKFYEIVFSFTWNLLNLQIPLTSTLTITPFSLIIFCLLLAMILKFIFSKIRSVK